MSICLFFLSPSEVEKKTALVYYSCEFNNAVVGKHFFDWSLCSSISKWGTWWAPSYHYPEFSTIWNAWCPIPISTAFSWLPYDDPFFWAHHSFLCSWPLQFSMAVLVFPFKVLYPSSDTTVAHAGISNCMLSSSMNTQCGDFLPNKEFYDCILLKQHVLASHFLTKLWQPDGGSDIIFILMWKWSWN